MQARSLLLSLRNAGAILNLVIPANQRLFDEDAKMEILLVLVSGVCNVGDARECFTNMLC